MLVSLLALNLALNLGLSLPVWALTAQKAVNSGQTEQVLQWLQQGNPSAEVKWQDEYGDEWNAPLLHWAAWKGDLGLVKLLLEKGVYHKYKNRSGDTALIRAASRGHLDVVKYLLEKGARLNDKDYDGNTLLMGAAGSGNLE